MKSVAILETFFVLGELLGHKWPSSSLPAMTVHPITNSSLCQSITYTANAELTGPFRVSPPIVFARNFLYSLSVGRGLKISLIVTRNVPSPPITVFFVFRFHNVPFFYYRLLSFCFVFLLIVLLSHLYGLETENVKQ